MNWVCTSPIVYIYRYDPVRDNWRTCHPMSVARHRLGVGVLDGQIYAVGGSAGNEYYKTVERWDLLSILIFNIKHSIKEI